MKKVILCLVVVLCVGVSQAAVINWQNVQNSTDETNVSLRGVLVWAGNAAGSTVPTDGLYEPNPTANGVQFMHTSTLLDKDHSSSDFNPNGAGDDYDDLLSTLDFSGTAATVYLADGLLTPGLLYEVQLWYTDARANKDRVMYYSDGHGSTSDQVHCIGTAGQGQYVKGVFTANTTYLRIDITAEALSGKATDDAHLSAYQIREVPEPATLALLGMGSLVLLRRRKA